MKGNKVGIVHGIAIFILFAVVAELVGPFIAAIVTFVYLAFNSYLLKSNKNRAKDEKKVL